MKTKLLISALVAAAAMTYVPAMGATPDVYATAVAFKDRPADAAKLDASRMPAEILAFEGLKPGMTAVDLLTGKGYYAELMARVVGPKATVVAYSPFAEEGDVSGLKLLTAREPNVKVVTDASVFAPAAYDFAMIHLNYHDFYWESAEYHYPRVDPDKVLARLFAAMKPGGIVAIIDHVGPAGDTRALVEKLHRIDPAVVKADFARAGFKLEAESKLLANPADDHTKVVFDPAIRGHTDRMVFKFRKPA